MYYVFYLLLFMLKYIDIIDFLEYCDVRFTKLICRQNYLHAFGINFDMTAENICQNVLLIKNFHY